ncbi:hypothetical protein Ddye_029268 [Dipteronia dyeriana]|uniref:YqgF/RNase H-like domain-containing protein n=1 Tax=Dipteronia dyeriana TaxID=168575 RepID=A0AAD9TEW3_9ROSI|nr:hypothetical protein Ddye_029268 [Dipteronia dyeriana]
MKYLNPMDFYGEIFKDILKKEDYLKPGRLLGLDVSDKYVSLAVSDWKNKTAVPLRALDRLEINMDLMADMIQSLISEHNLVGFVVGIKHAKPMDAQTRNFIDHLCKTGKVQGLEYTIWEFGITSKPLVIQIVRSFRCVTECRICIQTASEIYIREFASALASAALGHVTNNYEKCYAVCALQGYLDCTNKMVKEDWD